MRIGVAPLTCVSRRYDLKFKRVNGWGVRFAPITIASRHAGRGPEATLEGSTTAARALPVEASTISARSSRRPGRW